MLSRKASDSTCPHGSASERGFRKTVAKPLGRAGHARCALQLHRISHWSLQLRIFWNGDGTTLKIC